MPAPELAGWGFIAAEAEQMTGLPKKRGSTWVAAIVFLPDDDQKRGRYRFYSQ